MFVTSGVLTHSLATQVSVFEIAEHRKCNTDSQHGVAEKTTQIDKTELYSLGHSRFFHEALEGFGVLIVTFRLGIDLDNQTRRRDGSRGLETFLKTKGSMV